MRVDLRKKIAMVGGIGCVVTSLAMLGVDGLLCFWVIFFLDYGKMGKSLI
jgi:hypothetical protein